MIQWVSYITGLFYNLSWILQKPRLIKEMVSEKEWILWKYTYLSELKNSSGKPYM